MTKAAFHWAGTREDEDIPWSDAGSWTEPCSNMIRLPCKPQEPVQRYLGNRFLFVSCYSLSPLVTYATRLKPISLSFFSNSGEAEDKEHLRVLHT